MCLAYEEKAEEVADSPDHDEPNDCYSHPIEELLLARIEYTPIEKHEACFDCCQSRDLHQLNRPIHLIISIKHLSRVQKHHTDLTIVCSLLLAVRGDLPGGVCGLGYPTAWRATPILMSLKQCTSISPLNLRLTGEGGRRDPND